MLELPREELLKPVILWAAVVSIVSGPLQMAKRADTKRKRPWQDIAQEAQQYRDASIARVRPELPQLPENLPKDVTKIPAAVLSREEVHITAMSPEDLLRVLAAGEVTAVAVTTAFLRRAGLAQKLVCSE